MTHLTTKIFLLAGLALISSACSVNTEAEYPGDNYYVMRDGGRHMAYNYCDPCARPRGMMGWWGYEQQRPAQVRPTSGLSQEERTVYFEFNRATLTPEAKERLNSLAKVLKSTESVKEAKVVGYADRIGSDSYNEKLSQKRAEAVRDYLIANGYTNARVTETRWVGESEPSTECPANVARPELIKCLHNDRRVEVEIEYVHERLRPDVR